MTTASTPAPAEVFGKYSAYYDLLYRDKDYTAEAEYVARAIRGLVPDARRVLEFGCGTGKHGRLLARAGFAVVGIERSTEMVAAARAAAGGGPGRFEAVQGDIRATRVAGDFDAVISLFHVISYQVSNDDLRATFRNAARHLRPGGVFLFDVWHGPAVLSERPAVRVKTVEDSSTILRRTAEPRLDLNASVVTVRYTMLAESKLDGSVTTIEEEHRMRYLFPTEIDLLAHDAGFAIERVEEFGTGAPASERTWGAAYILRRTEA